MAYVVRIGCGEPGPNRGRTYVAITSSDAENVLEAHVYAEDDVSGLRRLIESVGDDKRAELVCAPTLTAAAREVGLPVGEPFDREFVDTCRHQLAFGTALKPCVDSLTEIRPASEFVEACARFDELLPAFAKHKGWMQFTLRARGKFVREAAGSLKWDANDDVSIVLYRDEATLNRVLKMIAAGHPEEMLSHDTISMRRDDRFDEFLAEAMASVGLGHMYLPGRFERGERQTNTLDDLMLLTATLDAFCELRGADHATGKAEFDDGDLEVELKIRSSGRFIVLQGGPES